MPWSCWAGQPPPPGSLRWCIGPPLKKSLTELLATDEDELAEEALAIYRERFGRVGLYENRVYEDIPEVLRLLNEMAPHTLRGHIEADISNETFMIGDRSNDILSSHFEVKDGQTKNYFSFPRRQGAKCSKIPLLTIPFPESNF